MDENQQHQFFKTLAASGLLTKACEVAGVEKRHVLQLKKADPEFAAKFDCAMSDFSETLEAAAITRARDGIEEPVFGSLGQGAGGGQIGKKRAYSDALLVLLLKKNNAAYRERMTIDANVTGGVLVVGKPAANAEEWKKEADENAASTRDIPDKSD